MKVRGLELKNSIGASENEILIEVQQFHFSLEKCPVRRF